MKEWYAAKELAGLPGMPGTKSAVIRKAKKEHWQFRDKDVAGGKRREYHLSSLPEQTRLHLLTPGPSTASSPDDLAAFLGSRKITLSPAQLADPEWQRNIACYRAYHSCPAYSGREKLLATLAASHHVKPISVRRWIGKVENLRFQRTPRIQVGIERVEIPTSHKFDSEALAYGLGLYARNSRAGMRAAYRHMLVAANERGWRVGDYSNFTRAVKKLPSALLMRICRGDIGFELAGVPKIIRQWTAVPVQSVLCGDQKIFDYVVKDYETDELIIPNGYLWMDCSSRQINGAWVELGHYNSLTVGNSLREALRYGMPDEIFTDWGKPEISKHTAQILQSLSGYTNARTFSDMGELWGDTTDEEDDAVGHRKAQAGKPWVKPIENIMNLIEIRLRDKYLPGYRKRMKDAWENKVSQAELKSIIKNDKVMAIEDFIAAVYTAIDEHNKAEKKLKEGGTIIPQDFFFAGLQSQHRLVLDNRDLDYICLPRFERKPRQCMVNIQVRPGDYRTYCSNALSDYRDKVWVAVEPYDREAPAILIDQAGEFLDLAGPWHVQHPSDKEGLARKRERQKELMKLVREQSQRLRDSFGVVETAVPKLTPTAHTARKAAKAKQVYELRKDNWKMEEKRHDKEATEARSALIRSIAEANSPVTSDTSASVQGYELPAEGKARYRLWLALRDRMLAGDTLNEQEANFYVHYAETADFRSSKVMHESFGDLYLGVTQ